MEMDWNVFDYKSFRAELDTPFGDEHSGYEVQWRIRDRTDRTIIVAQGASKPRQHRLEQAVEIAEKQVKEWIDGRT